MSKPPADWYRRPRRGDRAIDSPAALAVIDSETVGVLAMAWSDGRPYAVPISYARDGDMIYMHSATSGQKLDVLRDNPQALLCVFRPGDLTTGDSPCAASINYRSALAFGRVDILDGSPARLAALEVICRAHGIEVPPQDSAPYAAFARRAEDTVVLALRIEHVSGKSRA